MLPRRIVVVIFIVGLVLAICSQHVRPPSLAQALPTAEPATAATPGTPGALTNVAPYPDGVALTALALAPLASVPANPATIRFERFTLTAGDQLTGATSGPRLIAVESGDLLVEDGDLLAGTYGPTGSLLVPPDASVTLTAADVVTFLQFRIDSDSATPIGDLEGDNSPRVLLTGSPRLPRGEATLAIVRLEVAPGTDAGQRVFSGPVGLAVEAGSLTVVDLEGQPTQLDAGASLIAPAYTAHHLRNDGTAPVRGLAVGVLPASPALAGAPVATPTPAADVAATATIAALAQTEADLRATIAAQVAGESQLRSELATRDATAGAAVSAAQATTAAIALDAVALAADLGTASAQSMAAEATSAALRPTISALETELGTATAQQASLAATAGAQAIALQTWESRAGALATSVTTAEQAAGVVQANVEQAEATISAQALALQTIVATATAQALQAQAMQGTIAAQLADSQANEAALAASEGTRAAELAAAQATVTAQSAAIATLEAATVPAINPTYREVMIESDVSGVFGGNAAAQQTILDAVRQELQAEISQGCEAGLVLTFGYANDVGPGVDLAGAVNELLVQEIPEMFANAEMEDFASVEPPPGRAQIRVYLTTACVPASPEIAPVTPTSPPIVPSQDG